MNIPLNIDLQQILLHWMNLAILTGGLYFLLFKPVKQFMQKREDYYKDLDAKADAKLAEAEKIKAEYQEKLEAAAEEIHQARAKALQTIQQSTDEQLAQAKAQAEQIVAQARVEAEHSRERALRESQRELKELAAEATKKLALHTDPFEQFLDLTEGGHEKR